MSRKPQKVRKGKPYDLSDFDRDKINATVVKMADRFQRLFPHLEIDDLVQRGWGTIVKSVIPKLRAGDKDFMGFIYRSVHNEFINFSHQQYRWVTRFGHELTTDHANGIETPVSLPEELERNDYYDSIMSIVSPLCGKAITYLRDDPLLSAKEAVEMLEISKKSRSIILQELKTAATWITNVEGSR